MIQSCSGTACATDKRFVGDVSAAVLASMDQCLEGTYYVAGPAGMCRLELLEMLLHEAHRHRAITFTPTPGSIHGLELPENRPLDVSMRSDKLVKASDLPLMLPAEACRKVCINAFNRS